MKPETMKIYTKTGDAGETGLYGGGRLPKDAPRIEACGAVDELNATLGIARATDGIARATENNSELDALLANVQNRLFDLGAELATLHPQEKQTRVIDAGEIELLERAIDRFEAELPPLTQFILPGGSPLAASLHLARTICRRAERRVVTLARDANEDVSAQLVVYLNRLSDLLFVLGRYANHQAGAPDVPWERKAGS